jgi:O-antigen/teichoic acid export membrane protein
LSGRSELTRVGAWGLVDQALLSGISFLTVFAPARVLSRGDFGAYVLAFTSLLVLNGLQTSLFTGPHNVLGTARRGAAYIRYTASTAASQLAFAASFTAVAVAVGGLALTLGSTSTAYLALALAPAILAWQLQEFVRRVLYTENRLAAAVANDLVSYGGQLVGISVLWELGDVTGPRLLLVIAATSACGAVIGLAQIRGSLGPYFDRGCVRANWQFGKWLAGANAGFWLSSAIILYLLAAILGSSGPGILRAAQIVLGPLNILLLFLSTVLPILFSRALARGEAALMKRLRVTFTLTGPAVSAYCLTVALLARPILHALYGGKYDAYGNIVRLLALYYFVEYFGQVIRDVLKARRITRPVFVGNLLGGLAAAGAGSALIVGIGVAGGAVALLLGSVILTAILFRTFALTRSRGAIPEGAPLPSQEAAPLR